MLDIARVAVEVRNWKSEFRPEHRARKFGDEFLGIVFKDEEEGDYNFSMAILDIDL